MALQNNVIVWQFNGAAALAHCGIGNASKIPNCHCFAASTVYLLPAKFLAAWKACFLVILLEIARRRASSSKTNFLTIEPSSDRTSKQSWCWMILPDGTIEGD